MREVISSCRICARQCSLRLSLDDEGGVVSIRGDRANPVSRGYACIKGLTLHEAHASPRPRSAPAQADGERQVHAHPDGAGT